MKTLILNYKYINIDIKNEKYEMPGMAIILKDVKTKLRIYYIIDINFAIPYFVIISKYYGYIRFLHLVM